MWEEAGVQQGPFHRTVPCTDSPLQAGSLGQCSHGTVGCCRCNGKKGGAFRTCGLVGELHCRWRTGFCVDSVPFKGVQNQNRGNLNGPGWAFCGRPQKPRPCIVLTLSSTKASPTRETTGRPPCGRPQKRLPPRAGSGPDGDGEARLRTGTRKRRTAAARLGQCDSDTAQARGQGPASPRKAARPRRSESRYPRHSFRVSGSGSESFALEAHRGGPNRLGPAMRAAARRRVGRTAARGATRPRSYRSPPRLGPDPGPTRARRKNRRKRSGARRGRLRAGGGRGGGGAGGGRGGCRGGSRR